MPMDDEKSTSATVQEAGHQPVNSLDPKQWSTYKKHVFLAIISIAAFIPDFGSSMGIPAVIPQSTEWQLSLPTAQHSFAGNIFMLGAGGLICVGLLYYFGRLPVLVSFLALALGTAIWCAAAQSFNSYLAARILNGLFANVAQAGGLIWIQDIFHPDDYARKINVWSSGLVVSPYFGPMVSSLVIWHANWRWPFGILAIATGLTLIAVILFIDETAYVPSSAPESRGGLKSRLSRICGIEQWHSRHERITAIGAILRSLLAFTKIPVVICTSYIFLSFSWVVSVNATVGIYLQEIYQFGPRESGIFYIAGIIGVLIGWIVGHWLHDLIAQTQTRKRSSEAGDTTHVNVPLTPERRLLAVYPATILMFVALIILGYSLERHWHYMVVAVGYAVQIVGTMISQVAINAYLLDCYPEIPGEVGACVNFGRAMGGFMSIYVQLNWVTRSGPVKVFATQAAIVGAAGFVVVGLQIFGERLRRKR